METELQKRKKNNHISSIMFPTTFDLIGFVVNLFENIS